MTFPRPSVNVRAPPSDFDVLIEWFERVSYNLVLLEEYELRYVRHAIDALEGALRIHLGSFEPASSLPLGHRPDLDEARAILLSDHDWFWVSLDQLEWLYRIVEGEDHGGHRQALGQYGRVLAEALRRHRDQERAYLLSVVQGPGPPSASRTGKQ